MAKAGTGKGNAFASPGPSYPHLEIVRKEAESRVPTMLDEKTRERQNSIKQIAAHIFRSSGHARSLEFLTSSV